MKKITLIDSDSAFKNFISNFHSAKIIYIDTEFERRTTYFAKISLVQIAVYDKIFLIDAHKITDISQIKELLQNNNLIKVIHSMQQDIEIFYHLFKEVPKNIFDTQIAAEICGYGKSISYNNLVQNICQISLDKTEQKTNWLIRPLTNEKIKYAALDVEYLDLIYEFLLAKMIKENRYESFQEKIIKDLDINNYKIKPYEAWKKIKSLRNIFKENMPKSENNKESLVMIAALREEIAISLDTPRKYVLTDQELKAVVNKLPCNNKEFTDLRISKSSKINISKYKSRLFELCQGIKQA